MGAFFTNVHVHMPGVDPANAQQRASEALHDLAKAQGCRRDEVLFNNWGVKQ